ncbi:MAG: LpqB family beta-propeller domain-containing protein [Anaerolineae bacterium]
MRYITIILLMLVVWVAGCSSSGTVAVPSNSGAASPAPAATIPSGPLGPAPTAIPTSPYTPAPKQGVPALPAGVNGKLVFAPGDGSIWVQDALTAPPRNIVKASKDLYAEAPAFSPDGKLVAFHATKLNLQGPAAETIDLIGADGQNPRTLVAASDPKSEVLWPSFSPDGQWVYYTLETADHRHSEIHRVPVTGGSNDKVLDEGRMPVLSPDGKRLAFIRFNVDRFTSGLWIADIDGKNIQPLLREDTFLTIAALHFSPDGQWILFAASGPPSHELHAQVLPDYPCAPQLLCALAQPAYADGLPWDLWVLSPDGSKSRQLTHIGADSPWPVWSHDGKYIAFFQTNGIFLLDVSSGIIMQVSRNGGHGIMDWWSQ